MEPASADEPTAASPSDASPTTAGGSKPPNDHRALLADSPQRVNSTSDPASANPARSASTSSAKGLNPRSCVTCRRRKVRCNKENPCSNCVRAGIDCIFPGPGRAPRRSRKPPDAELLARLKRLEGVVTSLGVEVGGDGSIRDKPVPGSPEQAGKEDAVEREERMQQQKRQSIDKHLGRLVISDDRSRYVSNQFWASMGDEIAEMRDLLDAPSSADDSDVYDDQNSPSTDRYASHQGFIFGFSSLKVDLQSLYPSPSQIFILWEVYKENVDPVMRLIHRPTTRNILLNAASSTDKITRPAEALLFSIYYGAVTSLTQEQCRKLLDEDRVELLKKYRFATEQALARADFLNSSSLMCLQAFVSFLVFVRNMDDSRLVWALGGLAIHIAQALGIHRDGSHFGLPPFDTEMRRRLWWHVSILDNRSSEDHGTDPTFSEQFYDTKLPLNVNDEDIWPGMVEPPVERQGSTEMTFCLIRFELSVFNRRLNITAPGVGDLRNRPEGSCMMRDQTLQEKEEMIDRCHRHIEEKYLQHCDMNVPILWVSATVARLILAKMWLMVHHPRSYFNDGEAPPPEVKDRLFITSIEVIEFSYLLERNENTAKWGWLFRTYMQWQSVAFVLSEICARGSNWSPEVERGWRAVESVYNVRFIQQGVQHKGMLWKPMKHLWRKAQSVRHRTLVTRGSTSGIGNGTQQSPAQGDLTSGRWDLGYSGSNSVANSSMGDQPKATTGSMDYQNQQGMNDPWTAGWPLDVNNIFGASSQALGLDLSEVLTPESLSSGSRSRGATAQPSQGPGRGQPQKQHSTPTAMPMEGLTQAQERGVLNSTAGANTSDVNAAGNPMDLSAPDGMAFLNGAGAQGGGAEMSPDFLDWAGWNPGVGDFTVGPNGMPMGGAMGNDGTVRGVMDMQQEWF